MIFKIFYIQNINYGTLLGLGLFQFKIMTFYPGHSLFKFKLIPSFLQHRLIKLKMCPLFLDTAPLKYKIKPAFLFKFKTMAFLWTQLFKFKYFPLFWSLKFRIMASVYENPPPLLSISGRNVFCTTKWSREEF